MARRVRCSMVNMHTGEFISVAYHAAAGGIDSDALKKLNYFLRDWRRDEPTRMDPRLFDTSGWPIAASARASRSTWSADIARPRPTPCCAGARAASRSSASTRSARRWTSTFPASMLASLRAAGLRLQRGGVGFYPTSGIALRPHGCRQRAHVAAHDARPARGGLPGRQDGPYSRATASRWPAMRPPMPSCSAMAARSAASPAAARTMPGRPAAAAASPSRSLVRWRHASPRQCQGMTARRPIMLADAQKRSRAAAATRCSHRRKASRLRNRSAEAQKPLGPRRPALAEKPVPAAASGPGDRRPRRHPAARASSDRTRPAPDGLADRAVRPGRCRRRRTRRGPARHGRYSLPPARPGARPKWQSMPAPAEAAARPLPPPVLRPAAPILAVPRPGLPGLLRRVHRRRSGEPSAMPMPRLRFGPAGAR